MEINGMQSSNVTSGFGEIGGPLPNTFSIPSHVIAAPSGTQSSYQFNIPTPKALCLSSSAIAISGDAYGNGYTAGKYFPLNGSALIVKNPISYVMFLLVERRTTGITLTVVFQNNLAGAPVTIPATTINAITRFFDYPW